MVDPRHHGRGGTGGGRSALDERRL